MPYSKSPFPQTCSNMTIAKAFSEVARNQSKQRTQGQRFILVQQLSNMLMGTGATRHDTAFARL